MAVLRRRMASPAFSLVEILLVLAIIVIGTTLFVSNAERLIDGMNEPTAEEVVDRAVKQARLVAVTGKSKVRLSYDVERRALLLTNSQGVELGSYSVPVEDERDELMVRFREVQAQPYRSAGVWASGVELSPDVLDWMEFWPGGYATGCVVEVDHGRGDRVPSRIMYDPFSNARMELDL